MAKVPLLGFKQSISKAKLAPEHLFRDCVCCYRTFTTRAHGAAMSKELGNITSDPTPKFIVILAISMMAAVGGFLFGYDTGVITGAHDLIAKEWKLDGTWGVFIIEVITSAVLVGAAIGALSGGKIADLFGRRRANMIAGVIFLVAAISLSLSPSPAWIIVNRVFIGLGVGLASAVGPLYISETSPPKYRGAMISLFQMAIVIGILVAYLVDLAFTPPADAVPPADHEGWRWMFAIGGLPGILLFLGFIFLPASPRWLVMRGRHEEASKVLHQTLPHSEAEKQLKLILADVQAQSVQSKKVSMFSVKGGKFALHVAIGLAVLQQITGINAVIYYGVDIFQEAGFESSAAQVGAQAGLGVVNLIFTGVAILFIDKLGRRPLLLVGSAVMTICLAILSVGFWFIESNQPTSDGTVSGLSILILVALAGYIAAFAASLGPLVWTMIAEIFPNEIRGKGVSIASGSNWIANLAVSLTFLTLIKDLNPQVTFAIFTLLSLGTFVWMFIVVPETKGYTLEEIESNLGRGGRKSWLPPGETKA